MPLHLEVITPDKQLLSEDVDYVSVPGFEGEFGVLPGHIPYVSALRPAGILSYVQGVERHRIFVSRGFTEVLDNTVTVLAESAERAREIDMQRALAALHRAEERLHKKYAEEHIDATRAHAAL